MQLLASVATAVATPAAAASSAPSDLRASAARQQTTSGSSSRDMYDVTAPVNFVYTTANHRCRASADFFSSHAEPAEMARQQPQRPEASTVTGSGSTPTQSLASGSSAEDPSAPRSSESSHQSRSRSVASSRWERSSASSGISRSSSHRSGTRTGAAHATMPGTHHLHGIVSSSGFTVVAGSEVAGRAGHHASAGRQGGGQGEHDGGEVEQVLGAAVGPPAGSGAGSGSNDIDDGASLMSGLTDSEFHARPSWSQAPGSRGPPDLDSLAPPTPGSPQGFGTSNAAWHAGAPGSGQDQDGGHSGG